MAFESLSSNDVIFFPSAEIAFGTGCWGKPQECNQCGLRVLEIPVIMVLPSAASLLLAASWRLCCVWGVQGCAVPSIVTSLRIFL
jgi:hypothetical protein